MTARDGVQIGLYLAALFALAWPLGAHMARVYEGKATFIYRVMGPIERLFFHAMGVRADDEASWKDYAFAAIAFNALGFFVVYLLQRLQGVLPLNPQHLPAVAPEVAFNTASSFTTNTNWQSYGGETTLGYLVQRSPSPQAMRLSRLVRNLLDMTRFEAFGLALRAAPTSVEELVGSVLARFEGRPLTTKVPFGLEVHGDAVLLAQALIHLVENAVKRSPATEPIHVEARQRGGLLEIDVADRGARVSDRDEPSLLQKTFRAHETEGGRVGWTVARGIAEAHGGSLAVLDREGGGAVFRMSLPATPRTAAES